MSSNDSSAGGPSTEVLDHFQQIQRVDETIYLVIQVVGGHVLLPILVLTIIFARKVTRSPIFVNFCLSWIFSSVLYSLLVYRGRSSNDQESLNPSYDVCLIQASLLNGVQALTSCTSLALVIHLWMLLRSCTSTDNKCSLFKSERSRNLFTCGLLVAPFIVFVAFTVSTLLAGSPNAISSETGQPIPGSNLAIPSVFYCIILQNANFATSLTPGLNILRVVLSFSTFMSLVTVCFEVLIAVIAYKKSTVLKCKTSKSCKTLFVRVVAFSVYRVVALSLNIAIIAHPDELLLVGISKNNLFNGAIDFIQASIPLVVFIVFASEKDIFDVWCFWKKHSKKGSKEKGASPPEQV